MDNFIGFGEEGNREIKNQGKPVLKSGMINILFACVVFALKT
jgi:hypothetical protein